jgi:hypothetical protein
MHANLPRTIAPICFVAVLASLLKSKSRPWCLKLGVADRRCACLPIVNDGRRFNPNLMS